MSIVSCNVCGVNFNNQVGSSGSFVPVNGPVVDYCCEEHWQMSFRTPLSYDYVKPTVPVDLPSLTGLVEIRIAE